MTIAKGAAGPRIHHGDTESTERHGGASVRRRGRRCYTEQSGVAGIYNQVVVADIKEVWREVLPEVRKAVTGVGVWAALNTCNTSLENAQKSSAAQTTTVNQLKADLAQAQAKVQELTKENEQLKNPKMGKAETSAAKKPAAPAKKK